MRKTLSKIPYIYIPLIPPETHDLTFIRNYYVPSTLVGYKGTAKTKRDQGPPFMMPCILVGEIYVHKEIKEYNVKWVCHRKKHEIRWGDRM